MAGVAGREPWRTNLRHQDWVDVLDTDGRWCLGEVTDVRGQYITIHYLGWPIKWVETLPRDSDRFAPQLSKTGHLDGQTGEAEGRARVEYVRTLVVGSGVDAFDENMKVWRSATVEAINPERTLFTVRYTTDGRTEVIHTKKDYLVKPNSGNVRERANAAEQPRVGEVAANAAAAARPAAPAAGVPPVAVAAQPAANAATANVAAAAPRPTPPKPAGKGLGHNLKHGGFADVKDGDTWRIAEVIEVKEDNLLFRFLGWTEARWNVWLHRDSPLIVVPPFMHVKGDTGYKAVSRNYDCMHECMWKRAMVIGLGRAGIAHSQIEGIGHLLQVCFSLQDKLQGTNMVPGLDFKKWVQALEVAIIQKRALFNLNKPANSASPPPSQSPPPAAAAAAAGGAAGGSFKQDSPTEEKKEEENFTFHPALAFALDTITHIVKGLKEACTDADARADDVSVQNAERAYMEQVRRDFDIVEVPSDGNCLFAAAARADKINGVLKGAREVDGKTIQALVSNARNVKRDDSLTDSRTFRFKAIQMLNERPTFHSAVKAEVAHAIRDYGESTKGRLNQTNSLIFQEMKRQFPNPLDGANSPQALLVYSAVMGQDGIFGTDLESEALSEDLKCPVWVYYREGGDYSGHPTRIFGAQYKGFPICLAFYRANKHYNLLVPKKPVVANGTATSGTFSFQEGGPQPPPAAAGDATPAAGGEEDKNAPPAAPAVPGAAATPTPTPAPAAAAGAAAPPPAAAGNAPLTSSGRPATGAAPTDNHHGGAAPPPL